MFAARKGYKSRLLPFPFLPSLYNCLFSIHTKMSRNDTGTVLCPVPVAKRSTQNLHHSSGCNLRYQLRYPKAYKLCECRSASVCSSPSTLLQNTIMEVEGTKRFPKAWNDTPGLGCLSTLTLIGNPNTNIDEMNGFCDALCWPLFE
jgi:hypothetical protein